VAQGEVFPENPSILIAGCGTGRQAIAAATIYANSTVTAVDLSRASLSYALRKTREAGVSNIDYIQGDILELGCLNQRFHIVECAGVLHHMEDPMAGWRILTNLLEENGLMMIGLYSKTAHQHILKAHDLISKNGHSSSLEDIRRYRQEIISLAESGDPEMIKVVNTMDFFSLSECRDMLFHVQDNRFTLQQGRSTADNRFTLPQIEAALKKLGLKFMCFEISNPPSNIRPTDSLSKWHDYEIENPDTFLEMYQFWAIKKR
jgi:ubiquinone/menaquinone biosynthesis C-methylase UbiE